jgi:hypothetical protein
MTIPHLDDKPDDDAPGPDDLNPEHSRETVTERGRHRADDAIAGSDVGNTEGLNGNPNEPPD